MKARKKLNLTFLYIVLSVLVIVWLFPIFWILMTSFRGEGAMAVPYIIPKNFTLDHYAYLFSNDSFPFVRWFFNTLLVAGLTTVLSTFIITAMAYSLSRLRFKHRVRFLKLALILNMFPGFMSMIAVYFILKAMNLAGSLIALILVYSAGAALGFYIMKGFFDTIPRSLDESAMIDGASRAGIFFKITLPLAKPMIIYTALTAFMAPWVDFIFAYVILGADNKDNWTVGVGLFQMVQLDKINNWFTTFTAGCVLIAIPITLLFIVMQKYQVVGVTSGSDKG